jgi:choline dehydrogenase-like flavoprotein
MRTEYDFVVTGAGPAGCVLASRLTEDPGVSVLLLEAGDPDYSYLFHWPAGFAKMTKGIASWGWESVPQRNMKGRVLWYTQAKIIGGGSTINAQIYTRGNAKDYDTWRDAEGCEGWGYRDVLPYFKRAEGNERLRTITTVLMDRLAFRCRAARCPSVMLSFAPRNRSASPTTRTSTVDFNVGLGTTN